jgi:hypothetical protein
MTALVVGPIPTMRPDASCDHHSAWNLGFRLCGEDAQHLRGKATGAILLWDCLDAGHHAPLKAADEAMRVDLQEAPRGHYDKE